MKELHLIAAIAKNSGIGLNQKMPWPKLHSDMARFKKLTTHNSIIMGRKTFESIGTRPLPNRNNYIVRSVPIPFESAYKSNIGHDSLENAIQSAKNDGIGIPFVIGGSRLYKEALPRATHMHLTIINQNFESDTYFPLFHLSSWLVTEVSKPPSEMNHEIPYRFVDLIRDDEDPIGSPSVEDFSLWVESMFKKYATK